MAKRSKKVREKGKLGLSSYFKHLNDGDNVALVINRGVGISCPGRLQGYSGKVKGSRGKFKVVEIKDGNKLKTFIIHPVHLKKL